MGVGEGPREQQSGAAATAAARHMPPEFLTPRASPRRRSEQSAPWKSLWEASEEGDLERVAGLVRVEAALVERQLLKPLTPALKDGWTALSAAACADQRDVIRLLVRSQADPNLQDGNSDLYPLHWAASHETVQLLLDLKADPGVRNRDGKTPLEQARRWKLDSIVTVLEHADAAKVT